ncbi:MAG: hypothetical protein ABGZ37_00365, partial [Akkermansiaceae bacterium]
KKGLVPVNLSVVSSNGGRTYTALYRAGSLADTWYNTAISSGDYQGVYDTQTAADRYPVYVSAYKHGGQVYYSAIFAKVATPGRKDLHGMSTAGFQNEIVGAWNSGMLTRTLAGVDGAVSQHLFAASWWK